MVSLRGQAWGQGDGQDLFAGKRARSKLQRVFCVRAERRQDTVGAPCMSAQTGVGKGKVDVRGAERLMQTWGQVWPLSLRHLWTAVERSWGL